MKDGRSCITFYFDWRLRNRYPNVGDIFSHGNMKEMLQMRVQIPKESRMKIAEKGYVEYLHDGLWYLLGNQIYIIISYTVLTSP